MTFTRHLLLFFSGFLFIKNVQARTARIIGGNVSEDGKFPYVVAIQKPIDESYRCTGSIIAERFVITAAHCFLTYRGTFIPDKLQVVVGVHDLNLESDKHKVVINVTEIFVPAEYTSSGTGDIAVLKLKENVDFQNNPNLGKTNLPRDSNETYDGVNATVIGFVWGEIIRVTPNHDIPGYEILEGRSDGKMRYAVARVFENVECVRLYQGSFRPPITRKHICAQLQQRNPKRVEGVCSGDSGGPLIYNNLLIGVVNTSPLTCRENNQPGVYARVTEFIEFIEKVVSGNIDGSIRSRVI